MDLQQCRACRHLCVSGTQVFQLYSARKQLFPLLFSGEGVLGRWEHPRLFLRIRRRQRLGGWGREHSPPTAYRFGRFPAGQPYSARCKSEGRCMIWEVFQMHIAQRLMCSHCVEIACHRSSSGTPDLCWDMSSCLHVFHLAENDVADSVWELGSQGSGQLRKAALSLGGGCRQARWAASRSPAPARCVGEGWDPPKSRASSSKQASVAPGASGVFLFHH